MKRIDIIAGARPNFMKIAPIVHAVERRKPKGGKLDYRLIHTGQHYDRAMSDAFFEQLGIPEPHLNIGAGSGSQAEQTAKIMIGYERALLKERSDACLVVGDVTSTMACAITARKARVPVGHVEGGIRSGDWSMPEEINRVATDAVSNWFFTTSETANANLRRAGVDEARIFFTGNTMIDTLLANLDRLRRPDFPGAAGLREGDYVVATLHRPGNVDAVGPFARMLTALADGLRGLPAVFPVHPRTAKTLAALDALPPGFLPVDPQGYLEFIWLVKHAKAVITDSGGITEEATVLGVPCITLRDSTERPETVEIGSNVLAGTDPAGLAPHLERLLAGQWKQGGIPEKWDGKAAERIVDALERILA